MISAYLAYSAVLVCIRSGANYVGLRQNTAKYTEKGAQGCLWVRICEIRVKLCPARGLSFDRNTNSHESGSTKIANNTKGPKRDINPIRPNVGGRASKMLPGAKPGI